MIFGHLGIPSATKYYLAQQFDNHLPDNGISIARLSQVTNRPEGVCLWENIFIVPHKLSVVRWVKLIELSKATTA
jgi:hypothetical protein